MKYRSYLRVVVLAAVLTVIAGWQINREYRPPVLKAGVRLYAYVANSGDGSVSVVDLVALKAIATVPVGPDPSGLRALTPRKEIWGASTDGGFEGWIGAEGGRASSGWASGSLTATVALSA